MFASANLISFSFSLNFWYTNHYSDKSGKINTLKLVTILNWPNECTKGLKLMYLKIGWRERERGKISNGSTENSP